MENLKLGLYMTSFWNKNLYTKHMPKEIMKKAHNSIFTPYNKLLIRIII